MWAYKRLLDEFFESCAWIEVFKSSLISWLSLEIDWVNGLTYRKLLTIGRLWVYLRE